MTQPEAMGVEKGYVAAAKALIDADPTMFGHHESHVAAKMPYAIVAVDAYLKTLSAPAVDGLEVVAIDRAIQRLQALPDSAGRPAWDAVVKEELGAMLSTLSAQVQRLTEENEALRKVVSECAESLMNGAAISTEASLDFMKLLPTEIQMVVLAYKARIKALEEALRPFAALLDEGWASSHADNVALTVVWDPDHVGGKRVPLKDFRAARSALQEEQADA